MTKKGAQILITIQEMIYPTKNVELLSALFPVDALRRNARSKYAENHYKRTHRYGNLSVRQCNLPKTA